MRTHTKETQDGLTPELACEILEEGNKSFVNSINAHCNLLQQVNETSSGQFPMADKMQEYLQCKCLPHFCPAAPSLQIKNISRTQLLNS